MTITQKQKQFLSAFFDASGELVRPTIAFHDNDERTVMALERKSLVTLTGAFDATITDDGISYARRYIFPKREAERE